MKTIIRELEQKLKNQPQTAAEIEATARAALRAAAARYLCKYEGQKGTFNQVINRMRSPDVVEAAKAKGFKL